MNFKGKLLELCQQRKLPAPTFESSGKGQSHAMIFSATVRLTAGGRDYEATATSASSKKEAEMLASKRLLEQLQGQAIPAAPAAPAVPPQTSSTNPVGALQEYAMPRRTDLSFEEGLKLLQALKAKHGHGNVPQHDPQYTELATFVRVQRETHRNGSLDPEDFNALVAAGVGFRRGDLMRQRSLEDHMQTLARYRREVGSTTAVPSQTDKIPSMRRSRNG